MRHRTLRGGAVLAAVLLLTSASIAFADTIPADGDAVTPGNQTTIALGERAPGEVVQWNVTLRLVCAGFNHAPAGSVISVLLAGKSVPLDGSVTATDTTIGPVPDDWPTAGLPCAGQVLASGEPTVVTLTMPTAPGKGYQYSLVWARSGSGLSGGTVMDFTADVVVNTPPSLTLPNPITVEGNATNGAAVSYSAVATDIEDNPDPTPVCNPTPGSLFGLGTTSVGCTVTDSGGLSATGSFGVTVVDTTAPSLNGVPAGASATTGNAAGTAVSYTAPTATDVVDPNPSVACLPASGSFFPVGSSTVTCTATDASANHASVSFPVTVTFVPPVTWSATWGEPISSPDATFMANAGRTIPIKVEMFANGVEKSRGQAALSIVGCAGGETLAMPLSWDGGRWTGHIDTGMLGGGCYRVTASLDANDAGSFRLDLRGADTAGGTTTGRPKR